MDPRLSAQDVIRCDLCKDNIVQSYCDFCHVKLCKACTGEHISDEYDKHKIVSFQRRKSTLIFPSCKKHWKKACKLNCKSCDIFICAKCCISEEHKGHNFIDLEDSYNSKKANIEKDTEEIKNVISPTYEEIRKELESQIASLDGEYKKITTIMSKQGEECHTEIDKAIKQMKNEMDEIKVNHCEILKKQLKEIKQIESLIKENLRTLENLQQESNVVSAVMEYESRNNELRKLPPKIHVLMPTFCLRPIDREDVYQLIGSIKPLTSTTADENSYTLKKQRRSCRELLDTPKVMNTFKTGYNSLRSVSVNSDQEIWTSSEVPEIKCFNIKGKSINVITPKSGQWPCDIAVTHDGCLLYSDWKCKTVNKVTNGQVEEIIKLRGWLPSNMCVTLSSDLLVLMHHDKELQCKLTRYSESIEKQTIQYEDDGTPLYSGDYVTKYIAENRNLDICVADNSAYAVVVVNQGGKLRFRYTGPSSKSMEKQFIPRGIATNSLSQILTADGGNHCIHILDQDGQFLRFIDDVENPLTLCVDDFDKLFVSDKITGDVKVIKYLR